MKTPAPLAAIAIFAAALLSGNPLGAAREPSRQSADFIRLHIDDLLGKKHVVKIVGVKFDDTADGIAWFDAFTFANDGSNGSWIRIAVPKDRADSFRRYYGTGIPEYVGDSTPNKSLEAIVLVDNRGPFLEVGDAFAVGYRSWTSADGKTIQAQLLRKSGDEITIRRKSDGQIFSLPIEKLSAADREYLANL